jgi:mannose-6-phosphate isomerase-like protein (cupin superfamily)
MHRHAPGELYYAIEGEFAFYTGGFGTPAQRIAAGPGQVVPLAGGTPHTVRNETDEDAVALVVHAPGPPMENFSRAVAAASVGSIPDMNEGLAIAQRHGIELLRPIPALQR